ncbi:hypothetical protein [Ottowia testudinis]|uniref:Uncharacterized protein n=1 Tax=Ottowia testudinis TaxID=2816950 RepID=A0A975CK35_9BURK|nr:hypothetical protein [Ottowia testudinis]QTD46526.1 hypothetical protein J1M35_06500 [Ottowia testudinis]
MLGFRWTAMLFASAFWLSAHAGTKVINVELGVSTLEQVRKEAASAGRIQNAGTSTWSKGPILQIDNPDLGIEGVKSVQYIFDAAGKLSAVVMTMPATKGMADLEKRRFDEVASVLGEKYKLAKKVRPSVGDRYAKFTAPDTVIEIDAPHMSFDMEVRYMTNAFLKAFNSGVSTGAAEQRANEKSKF